VLKCTIGSLRECCKDGRLIFDCSEAIERILILLCMLEESNKDLVDMTLWGDC
jgi:hypothetical protein